MNLYISKLDFYKQMEGSNLYLSHNFTILAEMQMQNQDS